MQVLNSQRNAFLDMVAWSEGTDNGRQKTRNHGYDVIVGGELFTDYPDYGSIRFWFGMVQATRWIYCSVWHFFRKHDPLYQWTLPYTIP